MSSELTAKWLRQQTPQYRNADRVYADVLNALDAGSLRPKTDVYTYDDGRTQLLLCLHGLLPIAYRGSTYNIPVAIWLTHAYPQEPPIVYVVPTSDMLVRPSNHVDLSGKCNLEYTANWRRKPDTCSLTALLDAMQDLFSRLPPLYAKPRPKSQQYSPDSASQPSGQGHHLSSEAQPPDHGHVHPPILPPKPQPAHASSALGTVRSPAGSGSFAAATVGVGGLVSASVTPSGLSSAPPVTGTPPPAPSPFAARDISHSIPASNPQTPQTLSYGVAHTVHPQLANPPPIPPHPSREYSSAPAGPSSATQQTPASALPQGRPPVLPHPQPYSTATQAKSTVYSSPPPYVAPPPTALHLARSPNPPNASSNLNRPPTPPARPPVPPSPFGLQRVDSHPGVVNPSVLPNRQLTGVSGTPLYQASFQRGHPTSPSLAPGVAVAPPQVGAVISLQRQSQQQSSQPQGFHSQVQYASPPPPPIVAPVPAPAIALQQQPGPYESVSPRAPGGLPTQPGTASSQPYTPAYSSPAPTRPAPSIPPPDLLDEDNDLSTQVQTYAPVAAPPRPPNPQTVQLHKALLTSLRTSLGQLSQTVADTNARQRAMQAELLLGPAAIKDESARLVAVRDVCRTVAARWKDVVTESERRIAEVRRRGEVDVDEFVCATSIVGNQLINLVAEDNAIEDTMYHLHRALNSGRIDLERFLRTTRVLAEEQFMKRALVEKILNGLPMGMSLG